MLEFHLFFFAQEWAGFNQSVLGYGKAEWGLGRRGKKRKIGILFSSI